MEFYRQTIAKLISGLEPGDRSGRQAIYDRMRSTNEGYIEKNRDRLSDAQVESMRAQLDRAVDDTEHSFASVDIKASPEDPFGFGGDIPGLSPDLGPEHTPEHPNVPDGMNDPLVVEDPGRHREGEPEATDMAPPPEDTPPPAAIPSRSASAPASWRSRRFLAGLAVGGLVAYAALSFLPAAGPEMSAEAAQRQAAFEAGFQATREIAEKEIELIQRIETAILDRQRSDGKGLARAAGRKFRRVADVLPEFADVSDEVGDGALDVMVRATESDYKIRFNSPICATIRFLRPDLLDTRRLDRGIGCRYFGAWSEGGGNF